MNKLSVVAQNIKDWLSSNPRRYDYEYPNLDEIMAAAHGVIVGGEPYIMADLLYLLARDNEFWYILELLQKNEALAWDVARAGINHHDRETRSQIAMLLCVLGGSEAISFLHTLSQDEDAYVRLIATQSLSKIEKNG